MDVSSFSEIKDAFTERVHRVVWCTVATIDTHNRPRSRVLHPIWEASIGWILTRRNSHKAKHLAHNPYVSLTYVETVMKFAYVDCKAEWVDDPDEISRIWDWFKSTPEPLGYDPTIIFKSPDDPNTGLLKLIPWRIALVDFPDETRVWHAK